MVKRLVTGRDHDAGPEPATTDPAMTATWTQMERLNASTTAAWNGADRLAFGAIMGFALALRIACGLLFANLSHTDEIFQYIEPAHRAWFGYGTVTWEFALGGRSWMIPGLVWVAMVVGSTLVPGTAGYLGAIAVMMSLFALIPVALAFHWGRRIGGTMAGAITAVAVACWIELVYFAPKPLMDTLAAYALLIAIALVYPDTDKRSRNAFLWCGVFLGVGFAFRFHLLFAYAAVALYVCRLDIKGRWAPLAIGATIPVLAAGLLDWATWDYPFQSMWIPLKRQAQGLTYSDWNAEPWYYYVGLLTLNWAGALAMIAILALIGARRLPLLLVVAVVVMLTQMSIGIKVFRYIFAVLPLVAILAGLGAAELARMLAAGDRQRALIFGAVALAAWPATMASLAITEHFRTFLNKDGAILTAYRDIGAQEDLCGLGVVDIVWWRTGGYTNLHRDVPIHALPADEFAKLAPAFNYAIAPAGRLSAAPDGFTRQYCRPNAGFSAATRGEICVYRRAGTCTPSAERTFDKAL